MMVQVTKSERELQQEGQSRERDMRRSGERGGRGGWAYLTDSFMREHGADGQSGLVCVWETSWWSKRARVWQWIQRAVLLFKSLILSCSLSLSLSLSLSMLFLFSIFLSFYFTSDISVTVTGAVRHLVFVLFLSETHITPPHFQIWSYLSPFFLSFPMVVIIWRSSCT